MATQLLRRFLNNQNIFELNRFKPILITTICGATRKSKVFERQYGYPKNVAVDKGTDFEIDIKKPQLHYEKSDKLKQADETIKKILSLEYASRDEFKLYEENYIKNLFKKDQIEENSLEIEIALHTVKIRRLENYIKVTPSDKKARLYMYRAVYRRERFLLELMNKDYERFKWVKEKLGLEWQPPLPNDERRSSKYGLAKMQIKEAARLERKEKLEGLRKLYEIEKTKFFKEKERILNEIDNEIKQLGFTDFNLDSLRKLSNTQQKIE